MTRPKTDNKSTVNFRHLHHEQSSRNHSFPPNAQGTTRESSSPRMSRTHVGNDEVTTTIIYIYHSRATPD